MCSIWRLLVTGMIPASMQVPVFSVLTKEAEGAVRDIHDRMSLILDKDNVLDLIRPNGNPCIIAEKALTNMVFEKAVKYHRSPMEFITM